MVDLIILQVLYLIMAQYFLATGIIIININQCVILIVLKVRVKIIILNHKKIQHR